MKIFEKLVGKGEYEEPQSPSNTKSILINSQQVKTEDKDIEKIVESIRNRVSRLQNISAKEIMIPRVDVDFLDKDNDIKKLEIALSRSNHSRLPVYEQTKDKIIGILYAKDIIPYWIEKKPFEVEKICRKPYFVPESMKVAKLLAEFQDRHLHIAIVVDEYGGISGIVCLEDILEEIVGDIQDEFDDESEEDIINLESEPEAYICNARLDIDDINEKWSLKLPTDECDTIGGFLYSLLGRIPNLNEKIQYQDKNQNVIEFTVHKLDEYRIKSIKVVLHKTSQDSQEKQNN